MARPCTFIDYLAGDCSYHEYIFGGLLTTRPGEPGTTPATGTQAGKTAFTGRPKAEAQEWSWWVVVGVLAAFFLILIRRKRKRG